MIDQIVERLRELFGQPSPHVEKVDRLAERAEAVEHASEENVKQALEVANRWWTEVRHADDALAGNQKQDGKDQTPRRPQPPKHYGGTHA